MINAFAVLICLLCPTGDFKVNQKVSSEVFFFFLCCWEMLLCYLLFGFPFGRWCALRTLNWTPNGKTMKTWQFFKLFSLARPTTTSRSSAWQRVRALVCAEKHGRLFALTFSGIIFFSSFFSCWSLLCLDFIFTPKESRARPIPASSSSSSF